MWWAIAAYSGHLDLMRAFKGNMKPMPEELEAVAHGCPLAVLVEMVRECEESDGPLSAGDVEGIMGGAWTSRTPDWQEKAEWLLARATGRPILDVQDCMSRDFVKLPDGEQRLDWLALRGCMLDEPGSLLWWATKAGRVDIARRLWHQAMATELTLHDGDCYDTTGYLTTAVREGHIAMAQGLLDLGAPLDMCDLAAAAGGTGRVDVVQWAWGALSRELEEEEAEAAQSGAAAAAAGGTMGAREVAARATSSQSPPPPPPQEQQDTAEGQGAAAGHTVVQGAGQAAGLVEGGTNEQDQGREASLLKPGNRDIVDRLMESACASGSLELVRWLRDRGVPWNPYVLSCAARSGNEELVEWMVEQGYDVEEVGGNRRVASRGKTALVWVTCCLA